MLLSETLSLAASGGWRLLTESAGLGEMGEMPPEAGLWAHLLCSRVVAVLGLRIVGQEATAYLGCSQRGC